MPIFEYICEECRRPFEKLALGREEAVCCPACGSERAALQFSVTASPAKSNAGDGSSCVCTPTTCGCN